MGCNDAQNIFLDLLPKTWLPRQQTSMYGTNYEIEIVEPGVPTGIVFSAHVKGTSRPHYDNHFISCSVETKKLLHLCQNESRPVFSFIVDIEKKSAYWLLAQEYVDKVLFTSNPQWFLQKTVTLKAPLANKLTAPLDKLSQSIAKGLEYIYLKRWQSAYFKVTSKIKELYNSPATFQEAVQKEAQRLQNQSAKGLARDCHCSTGENTCISCSFNHQPTGQSNSEVQASLDYAQGLKLLDPKENRIAYYHLSKTLAKAAGNITPGLRYTVLGEMAFYDYLLQFMSVFDFLGTDALLHLAKVQEQQKYFSPLEELTTTIYSSLDEGELIAASMLTIRLADTYLFAVPYISKTFGQETASPLLDLAQTLLVTAHDIASVVETPGFVLQ
ncbi:hypothetical protein Desca_0945 [Desulfotomaculum nigrificans CO-1-SRB]|uniref:Uncharacterized protein n=1 Tax=Desulfotomaculum nigrificans (strain DSM 14880 / VKM B-2319 / CO-1-SRB) TaxID=868595 RepID=F6B9X3_DESCC|nr:DUF4365 domain-containing protein [Desulfotomaculum nigrificans]AEF93821.1 hypothetical protein Desca_0945 [Desulfotomaculum nigrificans CO-1-SRB]